MSVPRIDKLILVFSNGHAMEIEADVSCGGLDGDEDTFYPDLLQARDRDSKIEYDLTVRIHPRETA